MQCIFSTRSKKDRVSKKKQGERMCDCGVCAGLFAFEGGGGGGGGGGALPFTKHNVLPMVQSQKDSPFLCFVLQNGK